MKIKSSLLVAMAIAAWGMGAAQANSLALSNVPTAEIGNPGSFSSTFYSNAVDNNAKLDFQLQGYRTLDGTSPSANWDDLFTLIFNGTTLGSGYFRLGGGGSSNWNGTGTWTCTTCNIAQTNTGGTATFDNVVVGLHVGANTVTFRYTAPEHPAGEGLGNEAWSIRSASVESTATISAVPEPESYAMLLAGLGLMGTIARRRKYKAS